MKHPSAGHTPLIERLHTRVAHLKRKDLLERIQQAYARGEPIRSIARENGISNTMVAYYQPESAKRRRALELKRQERREEARALRNQVDADGQPMAYQRIGEMMGISGVAARKLVIGDRDATIARRNRGPNPYDYDVKHRQAQRLKWQRRRAQALELRAQKDADGRPMAYKRIGEIMGISGVAARKLVMGNQAATTPRRDREPNPHDYDFKYRPDNSPKGKQEKHHG
jgi:hypothetical protein